MPPAPTAAKAPGIKPSAAKSPKDKGKNKAAGGAAPAKANPAPPAAVCDEEDVDDVEVGDGGSEEDSDDEGVDEEGMARLMQALGKDGLGEFEQAQLQALAGDEDDAGGSGDDEWETDGEDVEDAEGASGSGSDGEDADAATGDEDEDAAGGSDAASDGENAAEGAGDIALDDVEDSVDEDAVPRQKIEIDNKVRTITIFLTPFSFRAVAQTLACRSRSSASARRSSSTRRSRGRRP